MPGDPGGKASAQAPKAQTAEAGATGTLTRLSELGWQALPALGSAIGFAGFVAVIGAAIEWIRFEAAHLPATQAVLAVPKQELVIIGALALSAFVVGAVLAVLLVYIIDSNGKATPGTARGLVAVAVAEMAVALFFIEVHDHFAYVLLGIWLAFIGVVAAYLVANVMRNFESRAELKRVRRDVIEARTKLQEAEGTVNAPAVGDQQPPTGTGTRTSEQKSPALLAAQQQWKVAILEWVAAADRIIADASKAHDALRGDAGASKADATPRGDTGGKESKVLAKMNEARKDIADYLSSPPTSVELSAGLDEAERKLGHVFRAVLDHLLAQLSVAEKKLSIAHERFTRARQALSGNDAGDEHSTRPDTHQPREDTARQAAQGSGGEQRTNRSLIALAVVVFCLTIVPIVLGIVLVATEPSFSWVAILLGVAAVLATMNLLVARATEKFAWYGVSVFFSVLLFGTALTIARTLDKPSVQPIALVRKGDDVGVCGVYITQTNERVYIGRLELRKHRPGLIFWVPTSDVELVDVGQLEHINSKFPRLAAALLAQLYKDRAEEAAPTVKNETITQVTSGPKTGQTTTTTIETPPPKSHPTPYPHEPAGTSCTPR